MFHINKKFRIYIYIILYIYIIVICGGKSKGQEKPQACKISLKLALKI